jgi:predicted small metal-binding protein
MAKHLSCREAGMDCDFEITSENEDELVDFVQIHSRSTHDKSISEDEVRQMTQSS